MRCVHWIASEAVVGERAETAVEAPVLARRERVRERPVERRKREDVPIEVCDIVSGRAPTDVARDLFCYRELCGRWAGVRRIRKRQVCLEEDESDAR